MGLEIIKVSHLGKRELQPSLPGFLDKYRDRDSSDITPAPSPRVIREVVMVGPDARNFTIRQAEQVGSYVCALVNYPDADNYEGDKIMLLEGIDAEQLNSLDELDPHFQVEGSVVARFRPDAEGWQDAVALARLKS